MVRDFIFKFLLAQGSYESVIETLHRVELPFKSSFKMIKLFKDVIQLGKTNRN
jgi:hypothetical protein